MVGVFSLGSFLAAAEERPAACFFVSEDEFPFAAGDEFPVFSFFATGDEFPVFRFFAAEDEFPVFSFFCS